MIWIKWWLWKRWSHDVRLAYRRCMADKDYVSLGDHEQIRAGRHWALPELPALPVASQPAKPSVIDGNARRP